ncbi:MAG: class I SAM-dependent methyltransferase [Caldisericia bacterium]|nr:class I SAM-dependent methyltransferase [Caldisericia bacterium]
MTLKKEWFHDYFNSDYGKIILDNVKSSYTIDQVDFILNVLNPEANSTILDLFCGKGRHSLVLAKKGFNMTSIDFLNEFIETLQKDARKSELKINTVCQDARSIDYRNEFDHIIVMFTSFGYFTDEENQTLLSQIRTALKPGGTCLIDVENRDYLLKYFIKETWREKEYGWLLERNKYYPKTSRHRTLRVTVGKDGTATSTERIIRIFSQHEILNMSKLAKLKTVCVYGDYDGTLCKSLSPRVIAVLKK